MSAQESMFYNVHSYIGLIAYDEPPVVLLACHPLSSISHISLETLRNDSFIFMNLYTSIYRLCISHCSEAYSNLSKSS